MQKNAQRLFANEKIEYFAPLSYADCKELRPDIIERCGILPQSVIVFL